jgi:hypothetical protein
MRPLAALACLSAAAFITGCGSQPASVTTTPAKHRSSQLPLEALLVNVRSGIVRIETSTCNGGAIGTGIVVGPRLVATVEHVVAGAQSISLKQNGKIAGYGTVVGSDSARDVALVRSDHLLTGYRFTFANRAPRLGESVTAIGFPLGLPLSVAHGLVSGGDRTIQIGGVKRRRLVQTDAAVNPGNSGGPLLARNGQVVGLVDLGTTKANGLAFAVSAQVAGPLIASWSASPQPAPNTSCYAQPPSAAPAPSATRTNQQQPNTYEGVDFSIVYPAGWAISHIREPGGNLDTTLSAPGASEWIIRVDENPSASVTDPASAAAPVVAQLRNEPGYVELGFTNDTLAGYPALRWEFEVVEHGVLLHKIDEFMIDGYGRGWGVLVQAPDAQWSQVASAYDAVLQTFTLR